MLHLRTTIARRTVDGCASGREPLPILAGFFFFLRSDYVFCSAYCSVCDEATDAPALSCSRSVHHLAFFSGEVHENFFP